jgi:hypothetical protein
LDRGHEPIGGGRVDALATLRLQLVDVCPGCDIDDAFELANESNPVDYVEGWIPGFGELRSAEDYAGLWHFINVDADGVFFNDVPGMIYHHAGPDYPGIMDIVVMAGADFSGLSYVYHFGATNAPAIGHYVADTDRARGLVESAAAASLGLLTFLAARVPDQDVDASTTCSPATHYEPGAGCQPGSACPRPCTTDADCSAEEFCATSEGCCVLRPI